MKVFPQSFRIDRNCVSLPQDTGVEAIPMLEIEATRVDEAIRAEKFCCDLEKCHGACCCIAGWRGAPVADSEQADMKAAVPFASRFLSERNLAILRANGAFEGRPGDYATVCVEDKECVFVYFDPQGIARCSFERAYEEGLTSWRKPLSCHLFPIRVRDREKETLEYEQIPECAAGRIRGVAEDVPLYDFLASPLTRKYGASWYAAFHDACAGRIGPGATQNQ